MPEREKGPTEQALNALYENHRSNWRRLFSRRALSELRLRAYYNVRTLDLKRVANKIPLGTVPDCANCTNLCCVGVENVVSLRLSDIAMLVDLGRTDLITKQKPNFPLSMLEERPHLFDLVESELWKTLPVLKQLGRSRVCAALDENNQCSLYPHWPSSCERFPYSFRAEQRDVVWGSRCPEKKRDKRFEQRSDEMYAASVDAFNDRVRDAVLLWHARRALDQLGIGAFLTKHDEDPFEPARGLPIIR